MSQGDDDPTRRPAPQAGVRPNALSLVVVDDDDRYRELAAEPFRKRGDRVRTTADGLEALAMCMKEPPDIILTDVQMPRLDGWQFLRLIRSRPSLAAVPVIFLTSLDSEPARLLGYQLGVDGYIPKPYTPDELLVRVHQILRRAKRTDTPLMLATQLRGELEHVALSSLLSFLEVEKKTGTLLVMGNELARFFLHDGRLLRVELEAATTRLTSFQVLARALDWTSGQFEFTATQAESSAESEFGTSSLTSLLLEHARRSDERNKHKTRT
jgi:DNA-binding response OmpR family regulator